MYHKYLPLKISSQANQDAKYFLVCVKGHCYYTPRYCSTGLSAICELLGAADHIHRSIYTFELQAGIGTAVFFRMLPIWL